MQALCVSFSLPRHYQTICSLSISLHKGTIALKTRWPDRGRQKREERLCHTMSSFTGAMDCLSWAATVFSLSSSSCEGTCSTWGTASGKLMSNSMGRHYSDDGGKACLSLLCQLVCRSALGFTQGCCDALGKLRGLEVWRPSQCCVKQFAKEKGGCCSRHCCRAGHANTKAVPQLSSADEMHLQKQCCVWMDFCQNTVLHLTPPSCWGVRNV